MLTQDQHYQAELVRLQHFTSRDQASSLASELAYLTSRLNHQQEKFYPEFSKQLIRAVMPALVQPRPACAVILKEDLNKYQTVLNPDCANYCYINQPTLDQAEVIQQYQANWYLPVVNHPIEYFVDYFKFPARHAFFRRPSDENYIPVEYSYLLDCEPIKISANQWSYPMVADANNPDIYIKSINKINLDSYKIHTEYCQHKPWHYLELREPQDSIASVKARVFHAKYLVSLPEIKSSPQNILNYLTTIDAENFKSAIVLAGGKDAKCIMDALDDIESEWSTSVEQGVGYPCFNLTLSIGSKGFVTESQAYYFCALVYYYYSKLLGSLVRVRLAVRYHQIIWCWPI